MTIGMPLQVQTQAVVCFMICGVVGLFYVRAIARNRKDAGQ